MFRDKSIDRRGFLRLGAACSTLSVSSWLAPLAQATAQDPQRRRSCILLWMNGGPSTIDLFDLKVGQENGGPFQDIATTAPGLRISEHLPQLAQHGQHLAVLRGMSTREGDHNRGTYLMRTGNLPQGPIRYPSIGAMISKELGDPRAELPNFVSIAPRRFFDLDPSGAGFLGPNYAPLVVGENGEFFEPTGDNIGDRLRVQNLSRPGSVTAEHESARLELLQYTQEEFASAHPGSITTSHVSAYDRATRLMQSQAVSAFDLSQEPVKVRERYGNSLFGQGCLLARRLVERSVPFIEVTLSGWDTHQNNFDQVKTLSGHLDRGWSSLMTDLKDRGLLDSTLIVWMGEFGRTPRINVGKGRDHYPNAWATVLAGGGIRGGQAIGATSPDGTSVVDRKVTTADLLATVCTSLGVDHSKQNMSNLGRPIRMVDQSAEPVSEVLS